jgi:hypothetical protein
MFSVQLEPGVMAYPGSEIAERVMACARAAYLQLQVALWSLWEEAGPDALCFDDMPTEGDLGAARERFETM